VSVKSDELVKSHPNRWLCKEAKFKAREARGVRRTCSTPQRQRAEAQRRNWTIYEAIKNACGWFVALILLAGCSSVRVYTTDPAARQVTSAHFDVLLQPQLAAGKTYFNSFRFVITNKTDKPFSVDWDDSYYLLDGRRQGQFGWTGMRVDELRELQKSPVSIVAPGETRAGVIFPIQFLDRKKLRDGARPGSGETVGQALLGALPEGVNGMELTVNLDGESVRETLTLQITSARR